MHFYKDISSYYEKIFPLNEKIVEFLNDEFQGKMKILDLACGDGKYSNALLTPGRDVTGVDIDTGMLAEAELRFGNTPHIKFLRGDMLKISTLFQKNEFDGVFCIGNSLVHLTSAESIQKALKEASTVLQEKGKFIVQIVNYDYVLGQDINSLSTIKNEDIEFIRNYQRLDNSRIIDFHTLLKTPAGNIESHQNLYALKKDELVSYAEAAGFKFENIYSSFLKEAWNKESLRSIFVFSH